MPGVSLWNNGHASVIASLIDELFNPPGDMELAPQPQPAFGFRETGTGVIPYDAELVDSNCGGISLGNFPWVAG